MPSVVHHTPLARNDVDGIIAAFAVAALCEVIDWPADRITDGTFTRIPCLGS